MLITHSASWANRGMVAQRNRTDDVLQVTLRKLNQTIYAENHVTCIFSQVPRINLALYENMFREILKR